MADQTPNHGLYRHGQGDPNWQYTADMDTLDAAVPVLGDDPANNDPQDGQWLLTDDGHIFTGDGTDWVEPNFRDFVELAQDHDTLRDDYDAHAADTTNPHDVQHSQLLNVSADDHHAKYTDSEAISAIENGTVGSIGGDAFVTFLDSNGDRTDIGVERINFENGGWFNAQHSQLSGVNSDSHHTKYTDSEAVTAIENEGISHGSLTNVSADDHHAEYTDSDAISAIENGTVNTIGGDAFVTFLDTNGDRTDIGVERINFENGGWFNAQHSQLSGVNADSHHAKYTDTEAVDAVENAGLITHAMSTDAGVRGIAYNMTGDGGAYILAPHVDGTSSWSEGFRHNFTADQWEFHKTVDVNASLFENGNRVATRQWVQNNFQSQ